MSSESSDSSDSLEAISGRLEKLLGAFGSNDHTLYQKRMEEMTLQMAKETLHKTEIEREMAELTRDAAILNIEAMKTRIEAEKAECAERLKMAQLSIQHYREFQRPSRQPGITIKQTGERWTMGLDGVEASGDTPAMAAAEFDHLWMFGSGED